MTAARDISGASPALTSERAVKLRASRRRGDGPPVMCSKTCWRRANQQHRLPAGFPPPHSPGAAGVLGHGLLLLWCISGEGWTDWGGWKVFHSPSRTAGFCKNFRLGFFFFEGFIFLEAHICQRHFHVPGEKKEPGAATAV